MVLTFLFHSSTVGPPDDVTPSAGSPSEGRKVEFNLIGLTTLPRGDARRRSHHSSRKCTHTCLTRTQSPLGRRYQNIPPRPCYPDMPVAAGDQGPRRAIYRINGCLRHAQRSHQLPSVGNNRTCRRLTFRSHPTPYSCSDAPLSKLRNRPRGRRLNTDMYSEPDIQSTIHTRCLPRLKTCVYLASSPVLFLYLQAKHLEGHRAIYYRCCVAGSYPPCIFS